MRRNLLAAIVIGAALTLSMWGVSVAQGQAGRATISPGAESKIALVDVAYVFKKYDKFNRLYDQMKAEVKAREKEITDAQTELKSLMAKKQQHNDASPTSKEFDQKIAQKKAELEVLADSSRREFTQKEASIYHQTYKEVEDAIKSYAVRNGITLVLRASRDEETSASNPQDVIKEVSQQVVYSQPEMDITEAILLMLNPKPAIAKDRQLLNPGKTPPAQPPKTTNQQDKNKPSGGTIKK